MRVNDAVQTLLDAGDWWGLLRYYTGVADIEIDARQAWLALGVILLVMLAWRIHRRPRPVYIPLVLGPVVVDLQPTARDTIHVVIGGTSGTGKSTSVLSLFDLEIGVLCIALDNTRPIAAKVRSLPDGIEWTNEEDSPGWGVGLDLLSGRPSVAAEVLVAGWAAKTAQDTGKWRDIATARIAKAMALQDALGIERNIPDLVVSLMQRSGNAEADRACQDWAGRLVTLADTLGPALGSDLELVQAMRDRKKVLLRLNRFVHPRQAPMLGGMLLVHGRRVAQDARVPFVLIVEEAGQMEAYQEHMSPIFQAGRDREVPVVDLTQNMSRLPLEVVNNASVWVSFGQEAKRELDFAAERLRVEPEQLMREAFKDQGRGWCYVRAPGVPTTLVRVKQQKPGRVLTGTDTLPIEITDTPVRTVPRVVEVIEHRRGGVYALPAPSEAEARVLEGLYQDGGCERWSKKHDRAGHKKDCPKECSDQRHLDGCYGLVWWQDKWQRIHRVRWELAYGPIGLGDDGKPLTVDHMRTCVAKDCSRLAHLTLCTDSENSRRRWRVRGVGTAAD